jgi:hypothetical protein
MSTAGDVAGPSFELPVRSHQRNDSTLTITDGAAIVCSVCVSCSTDATDNPATPAVVEDSCIAMINSDLEKLHDEE